jgi:hypothetical protein
VSCPRCKCEGCKKTRVLAKERDNKAGQRQAKAIMLIAGKSRSEVAEAFGCSVSAVYAAHVDARRLQRGLHEGQALVLLERYERRLLAAKAIPIVPRYRRDAGNLGPPCKHWLDVDLPPDNWPIGTTVRRVKP